MRFLARLLSVCASLPGLIAPVIAQVNLTGRVVDEPTPYTDFRRQAERLLGVPQREVSRTP